MWRWVQRYGPEFEQRVRCHLKPTNKSWRCDETYIKGERPLVLPVSGDRFHGSRESDFLLSAKRDANAAKPLFRKGLSAASHPQPRVINTDLAPIYNSAIPAIKKGRFAAGVAIDPSNT